MPSTSRCKADCRSLGLCMRTALPNLKSHFTPLCLVGLLVAACVPPACAHDAITSTVTFNREVAAIFQAHCVSCHSVEGAAFPLTSYSDARPWAKAIEEEVLQRRMPPWSAVRGFGEFRNDPTLSTTQMQQIAEWAEGGAPEGDAEAGPAMEPTSSDPSYTDKVLISGEATLKQALKLDGLEIIEALPGSSFRITANLPDGRVIPLLWIDQFNPAHRRPFLLREPLLLPQGSIIKGLPAAIRIALLTASP